MLQSLFGLLVFVALAWLLSENRRAVSPRVVITGLGLQLAVALLLLKAPWARQAFLVLNGLALALERATTAGTGFVFGYLGGADLPFAESYPGASFILAFRALPLVLVVSALSALLFHWRIMPVVVRTLSKGLQKTMGIGGALGVSVSANIFVGMIEAPLLVRPYLERMTRSELFTLMTSGMATIAGTVIVLYASILGPVIPDALGHVLIASVISAPAAIMTARLMVPETGQATQGDSIIPPRVTHGSMDAITKGTLDGIGLLLNITAMLLVLVALVALVNQVLGLLPGPGGEAPTLQSMLGYAMMPVAWLLGVPWEEARAAGSLLGTKVILNELLAYLDMAGLPPGALSERSRLIMTYALCGFANLGSLGIMIGGLGSMAPSRRDEVVALGARSIVSGVLATCMTGAIVGILF